MLSKERIAGHHAGRERTRTMTDLELVEKTKARVKAAKARLLQVEAQFEALPREWHQTATALSEAKAELLMAEKIEYIVSNAQVAYMR